MVISDISELVRLTKGFIQGLTQVEDLTIVGCRKLTSLRQNEVGLPQNLASLRCLKIKDCPKFVSLVEESNKQQQQQLGVPSGLQSLILHQCDNLKSLHGMHSLTSLRKLAIMGCPRLVTFPETGLCCGLEYLAIELCDSLRSIARGQLPSTLKVLEIKNCENLQSLMDKEEGSTTYRSKKKRRTTTSLHNKSNNKNSASLLERLSISGCESLKSISSGGELPVTLKDLDINRCPKLESIADKLHNNTSLESIRIRCCGNLKSLPVGLNNLTRLSSISISECPSLVYGGLPSIKNLEICGGRELESLPEMLQHNTCIERIHISDCERLKALPEGLQDLTHLSSIGISDCPSLISFPNGGLPSTNLRQLWICYCEKLVALPNRMHSLTSLQELDIRGCEGVASFPEEGFPTNLTSFSITNFKICEKLFEWGLHRLTSLRFLRIDGGCPDMVSFPEEEKGMTLPTSLTELSISNFPNLEYLSHRGFQNLTSLEDLSISNCPKLESFPEEGLPLSLLQLFISDCPLLQRRCKKDQGLDWPRISHIPSVDLRKRFLFGSSEK